MLGMQLEQGGMAERESFKGLRDQLVGVIDDAATHGRSSGGHVVLTRLRREAARTHSPHCSGSPSVLA
ncbi:hypothetical protein GCM10009590_23810 [Brachybacterium alimentarium]